MDLQLPEPSVHIITKVVSYNPADGACTLMMSTLILSVPKG
jgi:hypothetical protein